MFFLLKSYRNRDLEMMVHYLRVVMQVPTTFSLFYKLDCLTGL